MREGRESAPVIVENQDSVVLSVVVSPRSSKTEIASIDDDAIRVRLNAPPVDGKANEALVKLLAGVMGVPKRDVEILSGGSSRRKRVRVVTDLSAERISALLQDGIG
jgi:uncharacterized protein (TIGR00251 family)